jgi:hypothetical protein
MHYSRWFISIMLVVALYLAAYVQENNEIFRAGNWTGPLFRHFRSYSA